MRRYSAWHNTEAGYRTAEETAEWINQQEDPEAWTIVATSDNFMRNDQAEKEQRDQREREIQERITAAVKNERRRIMYLMGLHNEPI